MNKKRFRQITAWLLLLLLTFAGGCGKGKAPASESASPSDNPGEVNTEGEKEQSMGRYLEYQIELPEEFEYADSWGASAVQTLESGEIALLEESLGLYVSADKGKTWEQRSASWLTELSAKEAYIPHLALAPDGSAAAIYSGGEDEAEEEEGYHPRYLYVDPEGAQRPIQYTDENDTLHGLWFGKDSSLYGFSMQGTVYEISREDGSVQELCKVDGLTDYVGFTKSYMVILTSRTIELYDLEAKTLAARDEVLENFISEETGEAIGSNAGSHCVVMASADEDVLYLAMSKGLYRHVVGGTVVEQIADGNMNSLGDPQMYLKGMIAMPEDEFMILYNGAKLCHYIYDATVPAVPEEQLTIYSLEDDYTIRQAVSLYQKKNPGIYIRYEVGMTGDDGVVREDAIKNLNTKIMSGSAPDLIVLNGLPEQSYKEKGILADLTELEKGLTGENALFPNLVDAFREDGKIYSLPVRFRIPLVIGAPDTVKGITDLASVADAVEKLRQEHPQGSIIRQVTEEQVLYTLGLSCSGAWIGGDGKLDEAKLTEFLTQAKRVYEAEIAGWDSVELKEMQQRMTSLWSELDGLVWEDFSASASGISMDIAMEESYLGIGTTKGMNADFNMISTLTDQESDIDYAAYSGQVPDSFVPDQRCRRGKGGQTD
ncbi:MAG: carbohydrate ABC transporter substrate-binding protein [Lachnospiraceae bacterium]|nr:carbohydrate ABC transporter substrate-binding protein [Lachnospiraceae bacterium]